MIIVIKFNPDDLKLRYKGTTEHAENRTNTTVKTEGHVLILFFVSFLVLAVQYRRLYFCDFMTYYLSENRSKNGNLIFSTYLPKTAETENI